MSANDRQVAGKHYGGGAVQHWDVVHMHGLDYFQGQITKYVMRWKAKNGVQDLKKAQHFLEKYIELMEAETAAPMEVTGTIPLPTTAQNDVFQRLRKDADIRDEAAQNSLRVEGYFGDGRIEFTCLRTGRRTYATSVAQALQYLATSRVMGGSPNGV